MTINETVTLVVDEVMQQPIPLWIKILALVGMLSLIQTVAHTGMNIIYIAAYVYGFFKWLFRRGKL